MMAGSALVFLDRLSPKIASSRLKKLARIVSPAGSLDSGRHGDLRVESWASSRRCQYESEAPTDAIPGRRLEPGSNHKWRLTCEQGTSSFEAEA